MKHISILFCLVLLLTSCKPIVEKEAPQAIENNQQISSPTEEKQSSTYTASISFFGDLLMHNTLFRAAAVNGSYDFTKQYEDIAPILQKSDFSVGNLETTFAGNTKYTYAGYPSFNCPEQLAVALKDTLKIGLVTTANNHCLDTRVFGLKSTIDFLDAKGIDHTGTFKSKEDSDKLFIKDIGGIKVGFLSYTYSLNLPLSSEYDYAVNVIDREKIKKQASLMRANGANFIFFTPHWGEEYKLFPSNEQKELAQWLCENTEIDAIVGHHPHVVQPIEEINVTQNLLQKTKIVAYSVGNFIADQLEVYTSFSQSSGQKTGLYTNSGLIVNFKIEMKDNKVNIANVIYTPIYIDKNKNTSGKNFRPLAVNTAINSYKNKTDNLLTEVKYNNLIKIKEEFAKIVPKSKIVTESDY